MRWEVVSLVLGWTIGLVSLPLAVVGFYSLYSEGIEPAIRTFAIPTLISISAGYALVFHSRVSDPSARVRDRDCLLYTSPSPRDATLSRMPSSA